MAAHIHLGSNLQHLTGVTEITSEAPTVKALIQELDGQYPGVAEALQSGGFAIAIDGEVIAHPTYEPIPDGAEVHFIAAIQGG